MITLYKCFLVFAGILCIGCLTACQSVSNPEVATSDQLTIIAPDTSISDDPIHVVVGPVSYSYGESIGLVAMGMNGPYAYMTTFNRQGFAYFTIPAEHTNHLGYLSLIATTDEDRVEFSVKLQAFFFPSAYTWPPAV